jgi:hypothetical protein
MQTAKFAAGLIGLALMLTTAHAEECCVWVAPMKGARATVRMCFDHEQLCRDLQKRWGVALERGKQGGEK